MSNLPTGINEQMLDELLNNPGSVVSAGASSTSFKPRSHVSIDNRADKGVRPRVTGNNDHDETGDRINRPSPKLAERLNEGHNRAMDEIKADAQQKEDAKALTNEALNSRVAYLERTLKKVQSQLRKLEKQTDG